LPVYIVLSVYFVSMINDIGTKCKAIWRDELEYFDFNVFDKIILSLDLSMDVYQKIANKVSNRTKLRVCDLCDVINKISKE